MHSARQGSSIAGQPTSPVGAAACKTLVFRRARTAAPVRCSACSGLTVDNQVSEQFLNLISVAAFESDRESVTGRRLDDYVRAMFLCLVALRTYVGTSKR